MAVSKVRYFLIDAEIPEYDVEEALIFHRSFDELMAQAERPNSRIVDLWHDGREITAQSYDQLRNRGSVLAVCAAM